MVRFAQHLVVVAVVHHLVYCCGLFRTMLCEREVNQWNCISFSAAALLLQADAATALPLRLCCHALLLELLPVALTASTPLPAIVSTVTVTPVDINAALILTMSAEFWRVLL